MHRRAWDRVLMSRVWNPGYLWPLAVAAIGAIFLLSPALAQEGLSPVELAEIRGHMSSSSGIWAADDFGWFFYDFSEGLGSERLEIRPEGRLVSRGRLDYVCAVQNRGYEHDDWGRYRWVGFLGKRYLAGYIQSNLTEDISSLEWGELRKILADSDQKVTLTQNRTLALFEGYVLNVAGISKDGQKVSLNLTRDGRQVDAAVVSAGDSYVYKIKTRDQDLPVIIIHVAEAMTGQDFRAVDLDGVFQVETEPSVILRQGQLLGSLEVLDITDSGIYMQNRNDLTLSQDRRISLAPGLWIRVMDRQDLLYYPVGIQQEYGLFPVRGAVSENLERTVVQTPAGPLETVANWNATSFSGFYFDDTEENGQLVGSESLILVATEDRVIPPPIQGMPYLIYSTRVEPVRFELDEWGMYDVVSLFGNIWFSGYNSNTSKVIGGKGMLEYEQLGKVLIDTDSRDEAKAGDLYFFQEGYSMIIRDMGNTSRDVGNIHREKSSDRVFLNLLKDGVLVDNSTVSSNSTYVYQGDIGNVTDIPIIAVKFGEVFQDKDRHLAVIEGLFQISDNIYIPAESGTKIGEMVFYISSNGKDILLYNDESLTLKKDTAVMLWPEIPGLLKGMGLMVADNDTLRYYPFVLEYVLPSPTISSVQVPENVSGMANFSLEVRAGDVSSVLVELVDPAGKTALAWDLTMIGQGYSDRWNYTWQWNATLPVFSDDRSPAADADLIPTRALLYPDATSEPISVAVLFNASSGRIDGISDLNGTVYYVSPEIFPTIDRNLSYQEMLNDSSKRAQYIRINPGITRLGFFTWSNFTSTGQINHTLNGPLNALEPHVKRVAAPSGAYQLRIRVENAVNALRASGFSFEMKGADKPTGSWQGLLERSEPSPAGGDGKNASDKESSDGPAAWLAIAAVGAAVFLRRRG
ncbi:MAG: hypothetical protein A4E45_00893 [Methanosaeta sp. PtaB.Bin039]|nr:MAG: hypothetical protein A4E45_00893 [Methanosaeta sp. PtaB.Bin039]OPY47479.1 MAG: hypothetical protein A4E47_00272 [Methanosaeta sp. PtaU1.Bin028]HOT07617.1 S-layer protein domain-containing protein [Methanotrichaceae archaeon]HQF15665.1 S-layer protein domain-containing protein [Methanotrichaceae archaeon]HQI90401.1 S-layer protein domain-containing protein [Methanotrichaceae archaeon]